MGDKIKQINDYFRYSGIWIGIVLNPVHWVFDINFQTGKNDDEYILTFELYCGIIWIRIIIDNGEW